MAEGDISALATILSFVISLNIMMIMTTTMGSQHTSASTSASAPCMDADNLKAMYCTVTQEIKRLNLKGGFSEVPSKQISDFEKYTSGAVLGVLKNREHELVETLHMNNVNKQSQDTDTLESRILCMKQQVVAGMNYKGIMCVYKEQDDAEIYTFETYVQLWTSPPIKMLNITQHPTSCNESIQCPSRPRLQNHMGAVGENGITSDATGEEITVPTTEDMSLSETTPLSLTQSQSPPENGSLLKSIYAPMVEQSSTGIRSVSSSTIPTGNGRFVSTVITTLMW